MNRAKRHRPAPRLAMPAVCASVLMLAGGCLERKEFLTVRPDGALHVLLEYKASDLDELGAGDVMPSLAAGWLTDVQAQPQPRPADAPPGADPDETVILRAEAAFPKKFALPATYARAADMDAVAYLQFPTTITQERRSDGLYTHFARTYEARPWAAIERMRTRTISTATAQVAGIELGRWSDQQRALIVNAFADFEVEKLLYVAREAWKAVGGDAPQDAWLVAESTVRGLRADLDVSTCITLLQQMGAAQNVPGMDDAESRESDAINAEAARLRAELLAGLSDAVEHVAGMDHAFVNTLLAEVELRLKALEVTEDVDDERFIIEVEMPGEIVASNATRTSGSRAIWEFDGSDLKDVPMELMVTSRQAK